MCGIAGFYLRNPNLQNHVDIDTLLDLLLLGIEHRGRDATGFVAISDDGVAEWQKAAVEASQFIRWRRGVPKGSQVVLAHTRFATQGHQGFMENNHPIRRGPYFIIHNGHVTNDSELFRTAERHRFGQVDSEAIAARLASKQDLSLLGEVMSEIRGDAAVAAVDERDPTRLTVARGEYSPLYVYDGNSIVIFCSLKDVIEKAHKATVGHLSAARLHSLDPGDQIEWRGGEKIKTEFKVTKRYVWQGTKATTTKQLPQTTSHLWDDAWEGSGNFSDFNCDNCSEHLRTGEVHWRYDPDDRYTYSLCDECSELWDSGVFEEFKVGEATIFVPEEQTEIINPEDMREVIERETQHPLRSNFFDEYEEANNSILGRIGGLFGI